MTLEKIIDLGGCTDWGPEYVSIHDQTLSKTASACYTPDSLLGVMEKLKPRPEGRYVLLNALGAYEYWGINRNGDAFPEWSLRGEVAPKPVRDIIDMKVKPKMPSYNIPFGRYGHKTFVDFAHVYVGHANNDPTKSIGDVIASAYNEKMHRVELIVFVYKDRHPELIQKIDDGVPVPFSMGAKLAFDTCSICLNCARTRGEYCQHLSAMLGHTLPDGRKVFAYNFFPRFFDISYVRVPADRSAWGLKKVASVYSKQAVVPEKPFFKKLSEMVKKEPAQADNLGSSPIKPELLRFLLDRAKRKYSSCGDDPGLLKAVQSHKLKKVLATLTSMGILLHPKEVTKLSSRDSEEFPTQFSLNDVDKGVLKDIEPFIQDRSFYDPHFTKQSSADIAQVRVVSDSDTEEFTQYVNYLQSIDLKKLAAWVDTSSVAKVSLSFDNYLMKVAGVPVEEETRPWLPFATTISCFNSLTK